MSWLRRLWPEPPEPRGLYTMPGIPPPVPSRGMYLDPGQVPTALMQPAMDAGQPTPRERKERGGYAAGDMTVSEMPPPPPSVTVAANPLDRVWGVRHPQGWGLGRERVSVQVTGHPFGSRFEAECERRNLDRDCEYCEKEARHGLVYRDTLPWRDG